MSLGWFNEPDSRPESEEITLLWPKKGNVKEIIISHLYMFPSGNNKFDLTTNLELAKKSVAMSKKEMSNISTKVGLVLTKEHTTPLRTQDDEANEINQACNEGVLERESKLGIGVQVMCGHIN